MGGFEQYLGGCVFGLRFDAEGDFSAVGRDTERQVQTTVGGDVDPCPQCAGCGCGDHTKGGLVAGCAVYLGLAVCFERKAVLEELIKNGGFDPDQEPVNTAQLAAAVNEMRREAGVSGKLSQEKSL